MFYISTKRGEEQGTQDKKGRVSNPPWFKKTALMFTSPAAEIFLLRGSEHIHLMRRPALESGRSYSP
jgi:hypothetical protein